MRVVLILLMLLPAIGHAQSSDGAFDVYVRGIKGGVLAFSGEQRDGRYATSGRLESAGLVGLIRDVRYDAAARGRVAGGRYVPQSYREDTDTGRRQSSAVMTYRNGVPQVKEYSPPRDPDEEDLDPRGQGGTIDPMTALWGLLRDVPEAEVCRFSANLFDGARRTRISLGNPRRQDGRIACAGEYRRVAGYTPEDMAEKTVFPFQATYGPAGGGRWHVERIETETLFGRATLVRR